MLNKWHGLILAVLLLSVLSSPLIAHAATGSAAVDTWYVRPTGACANNGDGLAYGCAASNGAAGAFSAFSNVIWTSTSGVDDGDTLYVCGSHLTELAPAGSGAAGLNIIINGSCPSDAGSINTTAIVSNTIDAVRVEGPLNITVKNLTLSGRRFGILVDSATPASGYIISGNTIDQRNAGTTTNGCHGIYFAGGGVFNDVTITSNAILGTKTTCASIYNDGMSLERLNANILISLNTITNSYSGIDMSGASTGPYLITSNIIRNIRGNGVRIEGSLGCPSGMVVSGNVIESIGQWGVTWFDIRNSSLSNNTVRVFHDAAQDGLEPFGAVAIGGFAGVHGCAETGNTIRNNIFEANFQDGVVYHYDGTRATYESTNTFSHNRLNQSGSETILFGWQDDAANNVTEANHATWASSHSGETFGTVTYVGPVCSSQTSCVTITSDLRLPSNSTLRRAGAEVLCIDVRGRACYANRPDIGAYQATSGDPANTR